MHIGQILPLIFCLAVSVGSFAVSILQFRGKGPLLNNAYLYATPRERKNMDTRPHYRQSGVVFALIGVIFLLNALMIVTGWKWLMILVILIAIGSVVYALVSSIRIEQRRKH